tara:strand:- start:3657 stop:3869 length:213 start_codon:yes stop_codon:yes gene_type:complete
MIVNSSHLALDSTKIHLLVQYEKSLYIVVVYSKTTSHFGIKMGLVVYHEALGERSLYFSSVVSIIIILTH